MAQMTGKACLKYSVFVAHCEMCRINLEGALNLQRGHSGIKVNVTILAYFSKLQGERQMVPLQKFHDIFVVSQQCQSSLILTFLCLGQQLLNINVDYWSKDISYILVLFLLHLLAYIYNSKKIYRFNFLSNQLNIQGTAYVV